MFRLCGPVWGLLVFSIILSIKSAVAAPLCLDVFAPRQPSVVMKPVIGVLVEASDGQRFLVLDSYVGSSHTNLLLSAQQNSPVPIRSVLWIGEAVVSVKNDRVILEQANETSGLLRDVKRGDLAYVPRALRELDFSHLNPELLNSFMSVGGRVQVSHRFHSESFTEAQLRIYKKEGIELAGLMSRHGMQNTLMGLRLMLKNRSDGKASELAQRHLDGMQKVVELVDLYLSVEVQVVVKEQAEFLADVKAIASRFVKDGIHQQWAATEYNRARDLIIELDKYLYQSQREPWLFVEME